MNTVVVGGAGWGTVNIVVVDATVLVVVVALRVLFICVSVVPDIKFLEVSGGLDILGIVGLLTWTGGIGGIAVWTNAKYY